MDQAVWLAPTILIGTIAFITTNIDNLLLLILLFSQPNLRKRYIVIGQYIGFIVIVLVSTLGFFGKFLLSLAWIGFLGVVPIIMGMRRLRELLQKRMLKQKRAVYEDAYILPDLPQSLVRLVFAPFLNLQTYRVTLLTIGNGSDNISTYTPLFASGSLIRTAVLISLFLLLVGVWCFIGYQLARLPAVAFTIERYGSIILPFAFIMLGLFIMIESGTLLLLYQLIKLR